MNQLYYFLLFLLSQLTISQRSRGREHTSNDYLNLSVNRTIDLQNSVISIKTKILLKSLKVDPIYSYRYTVLKNNSKNLINIQATLVNPNSEGDNIKLKIAKQSYVSDENFDFYEINFKNEPINYEEERFVTVVEDYYERLDMLPKKIMLREDQLVVFKDTINHVSFYQTNFQMLKVLLKREKTEVM
jgi:hypothetical protein